MLKDGESHGIVADVTNLIQSRHDAKLLSLTLSRSTRSILAGAHSSHFRGRGMDFSESRHYQPGDDVRHIDWRVTARTGATHSKVYMEERERPVFIVIDFSPSIYFGTRGSFKSVTAARAATLLAWAAVQQGDRVGGVLVTENTIYDLKPKSGRRGVLTLVSALIKATALPNRGDQKSLFNKALQHLAQVVHPGSLVLLLSDFYHLDSRSEKLLRRIRNHNDMVAFMLTDPVERQAPPPGQYAITDGANNAFLNTVGKRARQNYQNLFSDRVQTLTNLAKGLDIAAITLENGEDLNTVMQSVFGKQNKGR